MDKKWEIYCRLKWDFLRADKNLSRTTHLHIVDNIHDDSDRKKLNSVHFYGWEDWTVFLRDFYVVEVCFFYERFGNKRGEKEKTQNVLSFDNTMSYLRRSSSEKDKKNTLGQQGKVEFRRFSEQLEARCRYRRRTVLPSAVQRSREPPPPPTKNEEIWFCSLLFCFKSGGSVFPPVSLVTITPPPVRDVIGS